MELKTVNIDGKDYAYSSKTVFAVEVGKGERGEYKPRYSFEGNPAQAILYYNGINIGNGYKKRLRMLCGKPITIARAFS